MSVYEEELYPFTKLHFTDLPKETQELITRVGAGNSQLLSLAWIFAEEAGYLFECAPFLIEEVVSQQDNLSTLNASTENEVQLKSKLDNARQNLERQLESQREKHKNEHFIITPGDLISIYAPARIPFNSCIASDKVAVNLTEGSLVLNMSVRFRDERPVVIRLRLTDDCLIRIKKTDINSSEKRSTLTNEFRLKEKFLDLSDVNDPFRLIKSVFIVSGIVDGQDPRPLSEVLLALGGGLEVEIYHHLAQGGGSSNIMCMSLLLAINYSLGRETSVKELSDNVLLAEYLTGSLGGWNDHLGGYYPGIKEFTAEPGSTFPTVREIPLNDESMVALEERLILWDSGDVRPSQSSAFKQALGTQTATEGRLKILRDQTRRIHHRMVEALQRGDMSCLGRLLTQKNILGNLASPGIDRTHFDNVTHEVSDLIDGASYIGAAGGGYYIFIARQGERDRLISQLNKSGVVTPWSLDTLGTEIVMEHAGLTSLHSKTSIDEWSKVFDRLQRDAEKHPNFHETIAFAFEDTGNCLLDFSVSVPKHLNPSLLEMVLAYTAAEINNRIMTQGAARVSVHSVLPGFAQKLDSYFEEHYNSPVAATGVSTLVGKALGVGRFSITEASKSMNTRLERPKQENIQREQSTKIRAAKIGGVNFGRMMTKVGVMAIDDAGQFRYLAKPRRFETYPLHGTHNVQTLAGRAVTAMKDTLKEAGVSISELDRIGVSVGLKLTGEIMILEDGRVLKNSGFTEGSLNEAGDSTFDLVWQVSQAFPGKMTFAVNDGDMEAFGISKQYVYRKTLVLKFGNELAAGYINEDGDVTNGINEFGNVVLDFAENAPKQQGTEVRGYAGGLIPWLGIEHNARELKLYDKYGFDETVKVPDILSRWLIDGTLEQKEDARNVFTRVGHYIAMLGQTLSKYYAIEHIVLTGGILVGETGPVISNAANRALASPDRVRTLGNDPLTLKFGALVGLAYKATTYC